MSGRKWTTISHMFNTPGGTFLKEKFFFYKTVEESFFMHEK